MDHSIKTRLLKKYEAGADACQTLGESPPMAFYSPFGPMIAKVQTPPSLLDRINAYADGQVSGSEGRELLLGGSQCLFPASADRHIAAFSSQPQRNRAPDAAAAAGDDCDLALKSQVHTRILRGALPRDTKGAYPAT